MKAYAKELREKVFPELRIGLVHGKLKASEKNAVMTSFSSGETDILVATTVIEVGTNDGFKIAEEDLRLRGPGDFFGSRQHGLPEMQIASFATDINVLKSAQEAAREVLNADPELDMPENASLKACVETLIEKNRGTMN